ncbi:hypothetical protein E4U56_006818 [Claviceps arundinis]|uniref:Uncharacterized protein n=2 Tax=Claviceps arundinis TaxID=1623583 RepID=A0A9P7SPV3_9HYPO|nr:hypothetical protein E4U56_006818 [Claviceps arundinis]
MSSSAFSAFGSSRPAIISPRTRDRQARGKDVYYQSEEGTDDEMDDGVDEAMLLGEGMHIESFADREKNGFALSVLDSPEQLMMFAQSRDDSITAQRQQFMAMLCGFDKFPAKRRGHRTK